MKKLLGIVIMSGLLAACQNMSNQKPEAIGMANPASEHCVKLGGKLEPRKDAQGNEYAICHLPDGRTIEEWDLYRSHNK